LARRQLILGLALLAAGCRKPAPQPSARQSTPADPYADGQRLATELRALPERWQNAERLPDCTPLLSREDERALCRDTVSSVRKVQDALAHVTADPTICTLAADAALTAQRASEALRQAGLGRLFAERDESPAASSPPPADSARALLRGSRSALAKSAASAGPAHGLVRKHENPDVAAIQAYARVANLGLRLIALCLEFAPLPQRERALAEPARLAEAQGDWAGLRALVREALLLEPDSAQKKRLQQLAERLGPR